MILKINLNDKKSINEAKNKFVKIKTQLVEMMDEFYRNCYDYFVEHCKTYLDISTIGENVKNDINNSWHYERTKNGARFYNDSEKAVYVEFGVGIVGLENKHTLADSSGYNYNIGAKINEIDGSWIFNVSNDDDIDIQEDYIVNRTTNTVKTQGSPSVMYAYNALQDLSMQVSTIWENIKIKYWS